jgi:pimeloyl-ACP methyl ester carboxylesterase
VVLVHGTPFSSYVWREVAGALARRCTVYVWDLVGYGESAKAEGQDVSLVAQGKILAAGALGHGILPARRAPRRCAQAVA